MRRFFGKLYVQVLIGVFAGVALGYFYPSLGVDVKPLGDVFIKLIKMVFAPIIFAMVVLGIARMENMKELGRVGARALIYFEVLSTFALVVPQLMKKLEFAGVSKSVVGLVVPSGVTFNPDGQCIYYTMAAIFIAQATNTPLSFTDQLVVLGVLTVTSKGSAGVTGSGFITLAATLASMGKIPVAGMVLLLGVDRFMSEARAITNTIGNAVGTVAIARWVGSVDRVRLAQVLDGQTDPEDLHALYEVAAHPEVDATNVQPILAARVAA